MAYLRFTACTFVVCSATAFAAGLGAQVSEPVARAMASVARRDSAGRHEFTLISQRYHLPRWYQRGDSAPSHIAVLETSEQHCCLGGEHDTYGTISLTAWRNEPDAGEPLWRAAVIADEGAVWGDFFRTTRFGCCDVSNEFTYFNLLTGGLLFVATVVPGETNRGVRFLRVPNSSLKRVIAFHDMWTEGQPPEFARDSSLIGVLQYGSPYGPLARIYVTRTAAGTDYRLKDIRFVIKGKAEPVEEADLWAANKSENLNSLSGFSIQVR